MSWEELNRLLIERLRERALAYAQGREAGTLTLTETPHDNLLRGAAEFARVYAEHYHAFCRGSVSGMPSLDHAYDAWQESPGNLEKED